MKQLVFWGTGDAMGVPRVYCDCAVCREARTSGMNRRLRSSVWLESAGEGSMLLDCGPDWGKQMEAAGLRDVRRVLITHAHFDHIGGLPEWYDALRWQDARGQLWAPAEVLATIRRQFPWIENRIAFTANDAGFEHEGWRIQPWRVCHGHNGYAYAYLFDNGSFRWAYCSDSINLQGEEKAPLYGLDLLVLGTSFYREDAEFHSRSVYDMVEAAELLKGVAPKQAVYTHMSHDVDLRNAYPLPANVRLAQMGMVVELGADS